MINKENPLTFRKYIKAKKITTMNLFYFDKFVFFFKIITAFFPTYFLYFHPCTDSHPYTDYYTHYCFVGYMDNLVVVVDSCRDCYIADIVVVGLYMDSACYCMDCYKLTGKSCYIADCRADCMAEDRWGIVARVVVGMRWSLPFLAAVEDWSFSWTHRTILSCRQSHLSFGR